jgi:hypothetical protein
MRITHKTVGCRGINQSRVYDRSIQLTSGDELVEREGCAVQGMVARALRRMGQQVNLAFKRR